MCLNASQTLVWRELGKQAVCWVIRVTWDVKSISFVSGRYRCALPIAVVKQWFLKRVLEYFYFFYKWSWVVVWLNQTRMPSVRMLSTADLYRLMGDLVGKHSPRDTAERNISVCPFFNMLVLKDQQREAVICMPKNSSQLQQWPH